MELPDFICIGAAKTGTNWLAKNLVGNDEVFIPPFHELRYFNSLEMNRQDIQVSIYERCVVANNILGEYLRQKNVNPNLFKWYANWAFTNDINDEWYARLFNPGKGKIKGDITPSYHMLCESTIKKISQLIPNVKIIFTMRYPADVIWSYYQMNKQLPDHMKEKMFLECNGDFSQLLESGFFDANTLYTNSIEKWERYFSKEQIHYCYYDDLEVNGEKYLNDIALFLGIKNINIKPEVMNLRYNTTAKNIHGAADPITNVQKGIIARRYHQSISELSKLLGGTAKDWENKILTDLRL